MSSTPVLSDSTTTVTGSVDVDPPNISREYILEAFGARKAMRLKLRAHRTAGAPSSDSQGLYSESVTIQPYPTVPRLSKFDRSDPEPNPECDEVAKPHRGRTCRPCKPRSLVQGKTAASILSDNPQPPFEHLSLIHDSSRALQT